MYIFHGNTEEIVGYFASSINNIYNALFYHFNELHEDELKVLF